MSPDTPLWVALVACAVTVGAIGLTGLHFFKRLCHPEAPTPDDVFVPRASFVFRERVPLICAMIVTNYCFYKGVDALFFWFPSDVDGEFADFRFVLVFSIAFWGSLLLLIGIDRLAERVRYQIREIHALHERGERATAKGTSEPA